MIGNLISADRTESTMRKVVDIDSEHPTSKVRKPRGRARLEPRAKPVERFALRPVDERPKQRTKGVFWIIGQYNEAEWIFWDSIPAVSFPVCPTSPASCRRSNPAIRRRRSSCCRWCTTNCGSWRRRSWPRRSRGRRCRRRRWCMRRISGWWMSRRPSTGTAAGHFFAAAAEAMRRILVEQRPAQAGAEARRRDRQRVDLDEVDVAVDVAAGRAAGARRSARPAWPPRTRKRPSWSSCGSSPA